MPFIKANDIEIYYETHGEGTPLVMVGGFGTNRLAWKEYIKPLSEHYQLILFENRGSGETDAPEIPYSIEMMAEDTAALMEALSIPNAHFMGHSMGSAIVMQMCIEHPDKVRKAMLCAGFAILPATAKLQLQSNMKLFHDAPFELVLEARLPWLYSNAFLSDPENVKAALHQRMHDPFPQDPSGYMGQADALMQCDLRSHLEKIQAHTMILAAEHDLYTPSFCYHYLMKHIPNAKLKVLKEQAHLFNLEMPNEVIELMLEFFI